MTDHIKRIYDKLKQEADLASRNSQYMIGGGPGGAYGDPFDPVEAQES